MPIEAAVLLFAARGIEITIVGWATVGQTLSLGLLLVQLTLGALARDPKIYDIRHPIIRFPPDSAELRSAPRALTDDILRLPGFFWVHWERLWQNFNTRLVEDNKSGACASK